MKSLAVLLVGLTLAGCGPSAADKTELRAHIADLEGQVMRLQFAVGLPPAMHTEIFPPPTAQEKAEDAAALAAWKVKAGAAQSKLEATQRELAQARASLEAMYAK